MVAAARQKQIRYEPHGGALALWGARERELLIEGPAGTGKTRADLERVYDLCITYPGIRVLFCRHKRKSLSESVLVTWEEKVLPGGVNHPCVVGTASREHRSYYRFPWASKTYVVDGEDVTYEGESHIAISGLDEHTASRTFSTEYDLIVCFEAIEIPFSAYQKLLRCLRNNRMPWQQIVAETNPGAEYHWLNQRAGGLDRNGRPKMRRILSRHTDNPSLTPEYLEALEALEGADYARLCLGKWVSEEGQIWPQFDPALHVIEGEVERRNDGFLWLVRVDEEPVRLGWTFASVDWGDRNPTVLLVWGVDRDGRMYLIREIYHTMYGPGTATYTVDWWAERVQEIDKELGPLAAVVCDHDPGKIQKFNDVLGPLRKRTTAPIAIEADKAKEAGWNMVGMALQIQEDDQPGLYLLDGCQRYVDEKRRETGKPISLAQEIPSYVWQKAVDGKPIKDVEDPTCEDHGCDALRYAVMHAWNRDHTPLEAKPTFEPGTYGYLFHRKKRPA